MEISLVRRSELSEADAETQEVPTHYRESARGRTDASELLEFSLPADCFQIVFGLLLSFLCGLLGIGIRL